jgi:hypothetical protein
MTVALRPMIAGEVAALLVSVTAPLLVPADVKSNPTVTVVLWPPSKVIGCENPDTPNPLPVAETCETIRVSVPPFVRYRVCVLFAPATTFPNATAPGRINSVGGVTGTAAGAADEGEEFAAAFAEEPSKLEAPENATHPARFSDAAIRKLKKITRRGKCFRANLRSA